MNRTLALRTVVVSELTTQMPQGAKVYYQQAQDDHPTTYAVYTLSMIDNANETHLYEVEVNLMGYGKDTSTIEDLADKVHDAFHKKVVINESIGVHFYADRRNAVEEEDRNILRRRLTFSAYLYER